MTPVSTVPDPFRRIPFKTGSGFSYEPPSPVTPVLVRVEKGTAPRGMLLRAGRAAGLACDREGPGRTAFLLLNEGNVGLRCVRHGNRICFMVGRRAVASAGPGTLRAALERALEGARKVPAGELAASSGFNPRAEAPGPDRPCITALVFENLFRDPDAPGDMPDYLACGSLQLASVLTFEGHRVALLKGRLDPGSGFSPLDRLVKALDRDGPRLVCITLLEACVQETALLIKTIKAESKAFVAVGGPMATLTPEHAAAHLEGADFIVRGDAEEALGPLADLCGRLDRERPLPDWAAARIMSMDGTLFLEPGALVMGHAGKVNVLSDLDASPFDVSLIEKRHTVGGFSIETSRGCVHPCTFCTAPSRGRFRARSAPGVMLRLRAYGQRLGELWGRPPDSSLRIQIPDDDFTCRADRAAEILRAFAGSGFLLSSVQASVRDFFERKEQGPVLDAGLPDALAPGLFQDARRLPALLEAPAAGRRERGFNSFVKLGVESFSAEELRRLGKGYRPDQVRQVVEILDVKKIVHDAYFIFSNRRTRINDIVDSLTEIARLKIEHPHTFYVRLPVVPHLVTTYPSPGFRIWLGDRRRGAECDAGDLEIGRWLRLEGFPEYDYPVVERDLPGDPLARRAAERAAEIFEPDARYLGPLDRLRRVVLDALPAIEREEGAHSHAASDGRLAARRLHEAGKMVILQGIRMGRENRIAKPAAGSYRKAAAALGPLDRTAAEARKYLEVGDPRLVLIPTRDCSLRCRYCPMDKEEGKLMDEDTALRSIELLLSTTRPSVILQFFGGEALLRRRFVLDTMQTAMDMAARAKKKIGFIVSTNGVAIDESLIELFSSLPVKVEVSIDGTRSVHLRHRVGKDPGTRSYDSIRRITPVLLRSGIPNDAIMVVNPDTVGRLLESFSHVADLGYRRVQVNPALGVVWSEKAKKQLAAQLHGIEKKFFRRTVKPGGLEFVDLWSFRRPMLLNCELTVDYDGTVYFGNGFLVRTSTPGAFTAGRLEDMEGFDSYYVRRPDNDYLLEHSYPRAITENNLQVGRILGSFVRHVRESFPEEFSSPRPTRAPQAAAHRW